MPTIFSKIVAGDIPCYKIAEDDNYFAFLDINPLVKGHTLVIPKVEVDYIFDLEPSVLSGLMLFAQKVAHRIDAAVDCQRVGVAVIGLDVPHVHVHLVPLSGGGDLDFGREKLKLTPEEFIAIRDSIAF